MSSVPGDVFVRRVGLLTDAVHRLVHRDGPQQRGPLLRTGRRGHPAVTGKRPAEVGGPRGRGGRVRGRVEDVGHGVVDEGLDGSLGRGTGN